MITKIVLAPANFAWRIALRKAGLDMVNAYVEDLARTFPKKVAK